MSLGMKSCLLFRFTSVAIIVAAAHNLAAAVIYGDIAGNSVSTGYAMGPGLGTRNAIADGFTMTSNYDLQSVDLSLSNFTQVAGSSFALSIYSDAGNKPGVDLYDLSTNVSLPSSGIPAIVNVAGTGSFLLTAGSKYWLDLYATNPSSNSGSIVHWNISGPTAPTGVGSTEIGQEQSAGAGNPPSGPLTTSEFAAFQLNGVLVPEPSSIALAIGAAVASVLASLCSGKRSMRSTGSKLDRSLPAMKPSATRRTCA